MVTLQQALAQASAQTGPTFLPHHPITCMDGELGFGEDGSMWCPHNKVAPEEPRLRAVLNHSVATLLIEEASRL